MARLYNKAYVKSRQAYQWLKANTDAFAKVEVNRYEYSKIVNDIFAEVANQLLEKPAGVYMHGLGYFAIWMTPYKKKAGAFINKKWVTTYNLHTDSYIYHPALFTELVRGRSLRSWIMDRHFVREFTSKLAKNLRSGKKYKFRYSLVKQMFITKNALK